MISVATAAASYDLTLLATVKSEFGITDRSEDANLARWIKRASAAIAKHCNRVFLRETLTETVRVRVPAEDLILSRYPVSNIATIIEGETTLTADDDYEFDADTGIVTRISNSNPTCWAVGKVAITYTAGYEAIADLPEDLQGAAIALVKQYRFAGDRDPQIRSEQTEGAGSQSYFDGLEGSGMSPEIAGLLSKHVKPIG